MPSRIIALEGVANVGKTTQAPLLREWLRQTGYEVARYEFPDYAADEAGRIMQKMITDGTYKQCEPHAYALLAAANMYARLPAMLDDMRAGKILVVDRYVASNIAYGAALGCDVQWITRLQQEMPPADVTVWVDGPVHTVGQQPDGTPIVMEADHTLQDAVWRAYERMCQESHSAGTGRWVRVESTGKDGRWDVHQKITGRLKKMLVRPPS